MIMEETEIGNSSDNATASGGFSNTSAPTPLKTQNIVTVPARQDSSVVSGVTEPNSMDQPLIPGSSQSLPADPSKEIPDDLPKQVVLSESGKLSAGPIMHDEGVVSDPEPLVVTEVAPDTGSTVSTSALPDPPSSLIVEDQQRPHANSATDEGHPHHGVSTPTNGNDGLDDYIKSPEIQNAIVERSPGGRYVRFMEKLGSGASKDVYRAYDTQEGIEVAWNVVNLSGVPKSERNRIVNEVRLLERLHHHNIISFHGSWVNRERQEVNFVTEILSSGTLKSFINKVQVIRWKIAKRWAIQILKGLEYLHSQDPPVIHRDLKCENIFINGTSGDLRIGDLGLSTVHRNGRVLSVLGTPEFMAPDMYEENSYDEKVDIYAFGMCMLEIFTQEIPYSECNNPAQIYRKVSSGEPPEVLQRLQSRHAREFVDYCFGYKNEEGRYVRPSATELMQHPFLVQRASDDDEVVVYPTLRERTIAEGSEESPSPQNTPAARRPSGLYHETGAPPSQPILPPASTSKTTPPHARRESTNSLTEEVTDTFEDMPESESNFRKVKVMMGRGQEWTENSEQNIQEEVVAESQIPVAESQYLVAAAVIENENLDVRPYADEILKLVVTLPVDGQTQNVQFDFHLVEDDPIEVAREMVQELGIPQTAVLEISETVSNLARAARMKQAEYSQRVQQDAQLQQAPSQQVPENQATTDQTTDQIQSSSSTVHARNQSLTLSDLGKAQSEDSIQQSYSKDSQTGKEKTTPPRSPSQGPAKAPDAHANTLNSPGEISFGGTSAEDDESDDEELLEELRKLDEDYQKNLMRAKKVFDNRMDNLQRSLIEREAQHQKTLEKHEKEKAEFEKRLAQEEEEQRKRMEQLQKEWDARREKVAALKRKEQDKLLSGNKSSASMRALQQEVEDALQEERKGLQALQESARASSTPAPSDSR